VHHFNTAQDHASAVRSLEAEHRANATFDGTMILFDPVIQIATLADPYRL
jgi:hypothetical protein